MNRARRLALALLVAPACALVDDPPDAAWLCRGAEPACPDDQVCVIAAGAEDGVCGVPGECFGPADADGIARPVADCVPCSAGPDDDTPHACEAGVCEKVGCGSACHVAVCGDTCIDGNETCDDGGTAPGDGCDATCVVEPGWACDGAPSRCQTTCGDRVVAGDEACDDRNANPADACDECRFVQWQLDSAVVAAPPLPPGTTLDVRTGEHCVVACVDGACTTIGVCGEPGVLGEHLFGPRAASFGRAGSVVYVADTGNHRVLRVDPAGSTVVLGTGERSSVGAGAPARALPIDSPDGVAVDVWGNLFVTSVGRVREVANVDGDDDADGDDEVIDVDGCGDAAEGVAVDGDALVVLGSAPRRCVRQSAP